MEKVKNCLIVWGIASLALPGQNESGDMHLVKDLPQGTLVAVVDGLGHGEEAGVAARVAIKTLENSTDDSLIALVRRCHEELRFTRGVVMSLAAFQARDNTLTWLGVGNVEGVLWHREPRALPEQEGLLLRGGVVGDQLPLLVASITQVSEGDLLILATDGIRPGFADHINLDEPPQKIAERILAQHSRGIDDALVLVARYVHGQDTGSC